MVTFKNYYNGAIMKRIIHKMDMPDEKKAELISKVVLLELYALNTPVSGTTNIEQNEQKKLAEYREKENKYKKKIREYRQREIKYKQKILRRKWLQKEAWRRKWYKSDKKIYKKRRKYTQKLVQKQQNQVLFTLIAVQEFIEKNTQILLYKNQNTKLMKEIELLKNTICTIQQQQK